MGKPSYAKYDLSRVHQAVYSINTKRKLLICKVSQTFNGCEINLARLEITTTKGQRIILGLLRLQGQNQTKANWVLHD